MADWREAFRELSPPGASAYGNDPPPAVRYVRFFGFAMFAFMLFVAVTSEPRPALSGTGLGVTVSIAVLVAGLSGAVPRVGLEPFKRAQKLVLIGAGSVALSGFQPEGAAVIGVYIAVVVAALRLPLAGALVISAATVGAEAVVMAVFLHDPGGQIFGLLTSIVPWLLVMRLVRNLRVGRDEAEHLVEELRASREAEAENAAQAERGRVAREMHDVLAHSLSALALQLEGARLLARDRGTDPEVVDSLERAHHLAAGGLDEARRAISALHGDSVPGPDGLRELAAAFGEMSSASCDLIVRGKPVELSSEGGLAVYRTAQEALTNVRKHAAADRVELTLTYAADGATLEIADHGKGAPVAAGTPPAGSGYGLTGMRERTELLGGTLDTGPTDDGFRVRLWLPA